ncbi:hypothetical protein SGFS_013310 [Streptomyces graminofaciens]|uniref:Uncharacterized protein n=1 Tax=Streptomyces graminofaciens TaxID=68212 RepID=A0ABN5V9W6_9ACTN|nr:hypothetical protein SGFS_013310 [Streptomyces graminofaciens]
MEPDGPDPAEMPDGAPDGIHLTAPSPFRIENLPTQFRYPFMELLPGCGGYGERALKTQPATVSKRVRDSVAAVSCGARHLVLDGRSSPGRLDDFAAHPGDPFPEFTPCRLSLRRELLYSCHAGTPS